MSSRTEQSPLIELRSIGKSYGDNEVIKNLDFAINHGEFVTILGPSGCGKTTVLRLIAGLEDLDYGEIILDQQDITWVASEQRPVNTVFQSYALFPHMSIYENVAFGLRMQRVTRTNIKPRVMEALEMVQLGDFAQRKPDQLSGGQQQRVAIARAVVNKPKVLLLDESLSALDFNLRKTMQDELKSLQRQLGITFVFVTHDQEEALSMSDRIIVMNNGRIEQDGSPREIYEKPSNLFVADFIGESNIFEATVIKRIDKSHIQVNINGYIAILATELPVKNDERVKVLLRPEDLRIKEINEQTQQVDGLIGRIQERNYKGKTLDSTIELDDGQMITVSEFFNEDHPDVDHSLNQKVAVKWVENWEVVLKNETV